MPIVDVTQQNQEEVQVNTENASSGMTIISGQNIASIAGSSSGLLESEKDLKKLESQFSDLSNSEVKPVDKYLLEGIKEGASDVHFTVGYRVYLRVDGALKSINSPIMTSEHTKEYAHELIRSRTVDLGKISEFDLTYSLQGRRFRVNIFKQMGVYSIVCRVIPERILTIEELGLPDILKNFSKYANGLILFTGPTGSGKSTSIASLLNLINMTSPKHIITLEDPVEFVFPKGVGLVDQREFGVDFESWANALRSVLRQDPDVVLIGEMRDLETIESALQISETGHLVFATLHTNSASQSIDRIIDVFPAEKQSQIRIQLSGVLRAVVSQRLIPIAPSGRRPACEVLLSNAAVKNTILEKKTSQIENIIQTSNDQGMFSLEKSLVEMIRKGLISVDMAKSVSIRPNEIDILLK